MIKSIGIDEDSRQRGFTPEKLKINNQGGGTSLWVPEEDVQVKTLRISKPAKYRVSDEEDGTYGYDEVIVTGVKPDSQTRTAVKTTYMNGKFAAEDDGYYGYSKVIVSVAGGGEWTDPDTGEHHTPDPSTDSGSAVTGEDEDGNEELDEIDENGKIKKTKLASYILIDTPPDKLTYQEGEVIDLTGAVVRGYLKNGTPYKNASYAESILPFVKTGDIEPVVPDPSIAEYGDDGGDDEESPVHYRAGNTVRIEGTSNGKAIWEQYEATGEGPFYAFGTIWGDDDGGRGGWICSPKRFTCKWSTSSHSTPSTFSIYQYTKNGITVYYSGRNAYQSALSPSVDAPLNRELDFSPVASAGVKIIAWQICYDYPPLPPLHKLIWLNWLREGDGKLLQTQLEIVVERDT